MIQSPLFDLSQLQPSDLRDPDLIAAQKVLKAEAFDIRQRAYESGQAFAQRLLASAYALNVDYYDEQKWCSIKTLIDVSPNGGQNRLPSDIRHRPPHECLYLEIKDIQPSDWQVPPAQLKVWSTQALPKRATYIPRPTDILLSRFKEPPGKCVIFLTETALPIYVSSNFIVLRSNGDFSPFALLAFLKSSFGLCQLNKIILHGKTTAEMYIWHVPQIALPLLPPEFHQTLHAYGQAIIEAEQVYRRFSLTHMWYKDIYKNYANAIRVLNELPMKIDNLLKLFLES